MTDRWRDDYTRDYVSRRLEDDSYVSYYGGTDSEADAARTRTAQAPAIASGTAAR